MTIRDKVAAYAAAVGPVASDELRYPLSTADAVALVKEHGSSGLRFPAELDTAVEAFDALPARPDEDSALVEWALKRKAAEDAFWAHFAGEVIEGVSIIRRQA